MSSQGLTNVEDGDIPQNIERQLSSSPDPSPDDQLQETDAPPTKDINEVDNDDDNIQTLHPHLPPSHAQFMAINSSSLHSINTIESSSANENATPPPQNHNKRKVIFHSEDDVTPFSPHGQKSTLATRTVSRVKKQPVQVMTTLSIPTPTPTNDDDNNLTPSPQPEDPLVGSTNALLSSVQKSSDDDDEEGTPPPNLTTTTLSLPSTSIPQRNETEEEEEEEEGQESESTVHKSTLQLSQAKKGVRKDTLKVRNLSTSTKQQSSRPYSTSQSHKQSISFSSGSKPRKITVGDFFNLRRLTNGSFRTY